jgi:hypothetical protein
MVKFQWLVMILVRIADMAEMNVLIAAMSRGPIGFIDVPRRLMAGSVLAAI